jgi:ATP-dependent helicase/nuclease subunit B
LTGKIDRVDFWQSEDGRALLRVVDYKTGSRHFSPEDLKRGFSLQMPLYLMALCRTPQPELCRALGLPPDTQFSPAGVTYLSSAIGSENTETRKELETALADARERLSREGLVLDDPTVQAAMSHTASSAVIGGKSKAVTALSTDGFNDIFDTLEETVTRISGEMRGGNAAARPQAHDGRTPCEFCPFGAICRVAQKQQ